MGNKEREVINDMYFLKKQQVEIQQSENAREEVNRLIDTVISQLSFSNELKLLPEGASRGALMKCKKNTGEDMYYSDRYMDDNGFVIKKDPIPLPFFDLFNKLSGFCEFIPLFEDTVLGTIID